MIHEARPLTAWKRALCFRFLDIIVQMYLTHMLVQKAEAKGTFWLAGNSGTLGLFDVIDVFHRKKNPF